MKITVKQIAHHRNGVRGEGFYVVLFSWRDGKRVRNMMATVFGGKCRIAVLDVDETQKGNVAFAEGNSWRGDDFETEIRRAIKQDTDRITALMEADAAYYDSVRNTAPIVPSALVASSLHCAGG